MAYAREDDDTDSDDDVDDDATPLVSSADAREARRRVLERHSDPSGLGWSALTTAAVAFVTAGALLYHRQLPPAERPVPTSEASPSPPPAEEELPVAPTVTRTLAGLGSLAWTGLRPPPDLPVWLPALHELLARDGAELDSQQPAMAIASGELSACRGHGHYDQLAKTCSCRAGYTGASCEQPVRFPCNDDRKTCKGARFKAGMSTSGGIGGPPTCMEWTRVISRCSGSCDETQNRCLCGERARYPQRNMKECEMKGIGKLLPWRDPGWARFAVVEPWQLWSTPNSTPPWMEAAIGRERLAAMWPKRQTHSPELAWCDREPTFQMEQAARRKRMPSCRCFENRGGVGCGTVVRSFCLNQCSARGECLSGYCACSAGWTGVDCSIPLVPPVTGPSKVGVGVGGKQRGWEPTALYRRARAAPPLRPSVYVYELPPEFNMQLQETRLHANDCIYRRYNDDNTTRWEGYAFGMEMAVHELLLASRHRTLDPETADFFFVPVYGGCYISRYFRPTPAHSLFIRDTWLPAPVLGNQFYRRALDWVKTKYPYWARRGGTDHIWAFPHDEGACIAPIELRPSILLTAWGRSELHPPNSTTVMPEHNWHQGEPFLSQMYGSHRCFEPHKDILMPVFTPPPALANANALQIPCGAACKAALRASQRASSPPSRSAAAAGEAGAAGAAGATGVGGVSSSLNETAVDETALGSRTGWLLYFRGQVLHKLPKYSRGVRQQAHRLFANREKDGILVVEQHSGKYFEEMRASTFCAVFAGNGWGHIEAPVMAGCIPVVVQDEALVPWEDTLDLASFGLRVPRSELPRLPQILRAIPEARVRRLQRGLARVWERFSYSSLALAERSRRCGSPGWTARGDGCLPTPALGASRGFLGDARLTGRDAVETLMHVLRAKLVKREQAERAEHQRRQGGEATVRDAC